METIIDAATLVFVWNLPGQSVLVLDALDSLVQSAAVPTWALVDSGISFYFRQHEHTAETRTEVFDQIQREVQGRDARHVLEFFCCTLLEGEFCEDYLAEVYTLATPRPAGALALGSAGPVPIISVSDTEDQATTEMDSDVDSEATIAYLETLQ